MYKIPRVLQLLNINIIPFLGKILDHLSYPFSPFFTLLHEIFEGLALFEVAWEGLLADFC